MIRNLIVAALLAASTVLSVPAEEETPTVAAEAAPEHRWDPAQMEQRRSEMVEKRHLMLHLSSAQEPAWQSYLSKTRFTPGTRPEHRAQMSEPERTQQMLGRLKEMEARLQTRLAALNELYAVLTPEQRTIFELSEYRSRAHWPQHHRGHWGGQRGGQGPGGDRAEMESEQE